MYVCTSVQYVRRSDDLISFLLTLSSSFYPSLSLSHGYFTLSFTPFLSCHHLHTIHSFVRVALCLPSVKSSLNRNSFPLSMNKIASWFDQLPLKKRRQSVATCGGQKRRRDRSKTTRAPPSEESLCRTLGQKEVERNLQEAPESSLFVQEKEETLIVSFHSLRGRTQIRTNPWCTPSNQRRQTGWYSN